MTNTAKDKGISAATAGAIVWQRKKVWGTVGMTHFTEVTINKDTYRFVLDQTRRGEWTARGWVNGSFFLYRDNQTARTLAGLKAEVLRVVTELRDKAAGK